jgi:hypothetical protein
MNMYARILIFVPVSTIPPIDFETVLQEWLVFYLFF